MTIQDKIKNNKDYIRGRFSDTDTVKAAVGASFLLSVTLLFFGPSYLYYTNLLQIPYYYTDLVWLFVAYSLAAGAILAIVLILLKGTVHQRAVAIVFALGLLFWIQGHILVWDYGILDGRAIIWEDYLINGIIDSAIWIALLALALFKGPSFYKYIALASVLLLVIQGGGLAAEVYQAPDEPEWKSYAIGYDDEAMFEFSSEQNVIILVLDAFRSDVFQEIIEEEPEYRDMFDGFTYYRNAVSGFPHTDLVPTLILTGEYYDNSVPRSEYVKSAFLDASIPLMLKDHGYYVGLYPLMARTVFHSEQTSSNIGSPHHEQKDRLIDKHEEFVELHYISLFRHVPHFIKRHFHFMPFIGSGRDGDTPRDLVFYNTLVSDFRVSNEKKVFMFYHNLGPHPPLTLNANLQFEELPFNHSGYKEQAKASLRISYELIKKMKESDIYDKSMIFIVADHGAFSSGHGARDEINISLLGYHTPSDSYDFFNQGVVSQGIPLILVKPFNNSGDMVISDAPVALGDIPQTIADELELSQEFTGQSIFSINESDVRERYFFRYIGTREEYDSGYLPTLRKYKIVGHSWLINSWEPTTHRYEPGKGHIPLTSYQLNTPIIFGVNGTAQQYQLTGWSGPEEGFTWTSGYQAGLALQMEDTDTDLTLTILASPYFGGGALDQQHVIIQVNGQKIGEWVYDTPGLQEKSILIPQWALSDDEIQYITFELPDAMSPRELGQSEDGRDLALAVRSMVIVVDCCGNQ
ncbi:hypothetical protein J2T58_000565 [Methanocalculus alkaliphilus]|uniref:sulfatase-like hydrolase/transferase n=1 Tax=Methanocalculus alkaliphilus TaxID=768730 RepID=UPI00209E5FC5|nr:sulfatase-like hydrolase/transferase [Methanocalculus alkaliphilus]MCP1714725.1 hypothetical protein [Methanocalculus alkaliphilus]